MHRLLTALGRGFKEKIGWKRLGIAASLLIIVLAVMHLVTTLKGVDTNLVLTALTEIPTHQIALAALCVVGAFCTLTFYDYFALRTIGKNHVPYRIAARSSFGFKHVHVSRGLFGGQEMGTCSPRFPTPSSRPHAGAT